MNRHNNLRVLTVLSAFLLMATTAGAQSEDLKAAYLRADSLREFSNMVNDLVLQSDWIGESHSFWYSARTADGTRYYLVDADKKSRKSALDTKKFCEAFQAASGKELKPESLQLRGLKFSDDLKSFEFLSERTRYSCRLKDYKIEKLGELPDRREGYWGNSFDELGNDPVSSPDSLYQAYIKNYNLFVRDLKSRKETQLSFDGSEGEPYSSYLYWSPDSKKIAGVRVRPNTKRYMYLVESSPSDQFLPKFYQKEYLRAGDALPVKFPVLFSVEEMKQIGVDATPYLEQFSLENLSWNGDSKAFTFEYNQRGHQLYQVVRVDAGSGEARVLIEEKSPTFIDYSGKHYCYDVNKGEQIIWASERDGWNHLYLFDGTTGKLINRITGGNWLVREVVKVDEENRQLIFAAAGMNSDEDPYFIHYFRTGFDGSGLTELTPEKLNHQARFSDDNKLMIDTYSSADHPQVTVLRNAETGAVLMELEKADISKLLARGYRLPEPFVAKARDGKTDIWGNIYRPTSFDPSKSYPVIEYIYAGPQSSFVQKSFYPYSYPFSGLAELGFIVVQIDGMGTSNRSKAFHDVCYKNLKDAGFPDRILWIKAAAEKYPYMDTTRVGIFGGSAGGQNSSAGVLFYPDFYDVAVSACGCHDNRLDKMWWNEQWMGYPVGPEYSECSNIDNAARLEGHLMLIVGELDDNVDPSSTYRFADALIKAGKDFELVVLPGSNHTLGGDYGEHKRRDFFVRYLLGQEPPAWGALK
ncbi:MAG: prolyl oligopeptidase family serine peptidase [Bacteroidota bacterium]